MSCRVHEARDTDAFVNVEQQQGLSDWEAYLSRPVLPELDAVPIETFYAEWITRSQSLKPDGAENDARRSRLENYNSKTRTVYVGTDPTAHRRIGVTSLLPPAPIAPRYYWRRRVGFDQAALQHQPVDDESMNEHEGGRVINEGDDEDAGGNEGEDERDAEGEDEAAANKVGEDDNDDDDGEAGNDEEAEGDDNEEGDADDIAPAEHAANYVADDVADDADEPHLVRLTRVPFRKTSLYFLRELARHRGARSYSGLLTDTMGVTHLTAQAACRALGYLDEAAEARDLLRRQRLYGMPDIVRMYDITPIMLRSLFVQLCVAQHAMDKIIDDRGLLEAMSEPGWTNDDVLDDLSVRLWALPGNWDVAHVLPPHRQPSVVRSDLDRALRDLPAPHVWQARLRAAEPKLQVDEHQAAVVHWALTGRTVVSRDPNNLVHSTYVRPRSVEVAVLVGGSGVGKSQVCQRLIAEFGIRGMLVMPTAISNLAATAFNGTTVHALFGLGIDSDDEGNFLIALKTEGGTVTPDRDQMLSDARCACVIIDEGLAGARTLLESVVEFCRRREYGLRIIINGDSTQLPPVVPYGSPTEVAAMSLVTSWVWHSADAHFKLTKQYRAAADPAWARFGVSLANGTAPSVATHAFSNPAEHATAVAAPLITNVFVHQPLSAVGRHLQREVAINALYELYGKTATGDLDVYRNFSRQPRHILCATNSQCHWWNALVEELRAGVDRHATTYVAINDAYLAGGEPMTRTLANDALRDEASMFDNVDHSVPLSTVVLHVGDIIMLPVCSSSLGAHSNPPKMASGSPTRASVHRVPVAVPQKTIDRQANLVKNAVLRVTHLDWCSIHVMDEKTSASHVLCRQRFHFKLRRHLSAIEIHRFQIPAQVAWAITVNKAQGKTIERALLDLRKPYWQHGSAHVAPTRVPCARDCLAFVDRASSICIGGNIVPVLRNVVFPDLVLD